MKWTFAAEIYRKLGEGLGLLDPHPLHEADPKRVKRALDTLEEFKWDGGRKALTSRQSGGWSTKDGHNGGPRCVGQLLCARMVFGAKEIGGDAGTL